MRTKKTINGCRVLVLAVAVFGILVGCGTTRNQPIQTPQIKPAGFATDLPDYVIGPQDELDIKFFYNPELNETVTVRPDGMISLQLVDDVKAAGQTPSKLDEVLTKKYASQLKQPEITVLVKTFAGRQVYVGGEVVTPGLIDLTGGLTPLQAVITAGGFTENAKPEAAILIRKGPDNRPVPIPLNLEEAMEGDIGKAENDYLLTASDIVYVPKSGIAKANKFVSQYIENLLLFKGVSLGFGYDLRGDDD